MNEGRVFIGRLEEFDRLLRAEGGFGGEANAVEAFRQWADTQWWPPSSPDE
jgi:hypothetical protein